VPGADGFEAALAAAERADDPATISAMLDALGSVETMAGRMRRTHLLSLRRLQLLPRLPGHDPAAGAELHDVLHMAVENALSAGELPEALEAARALSDETTAPITGLMLASKPIVALVLTGRFDEVVERGVRTRQEWITAGGPPARWLAPSIYAVALACGLLGRADEYEDWRRFALDHIAGAQTRNVHFQVGGMATFADARLALHEGRFDDAVRTLADVPRRPDAWQTVRHWYFDAYPWALAAEVAVAAGSADAPDRLIAATPIGAENAWSAACLARARGRHTGDTAALLESVAGWERINARYERASTLLLVPGRADEGRSELAAMGVTVPQHS
jgi:hypothetical protein